MKLEVCDWDDTYGIVQTGPEQANLLNPRWWVYILRMNNTMYCKQRYGDYMDDMKNFESVPTPKNWLMS